MTDREQLTNVAELGAHLARRRRELGITQEELALTVGVNRRVIGELERGKETVRAGIALAALQSVGTRLVAEER